MPYTAMDVHQVQLSVLPSCLSLSLMRAALLYQINPGSHLPTFGLLEVRESSTTHRAHQGLCCLWAPFLRRPPGLGLGVDRGLAFRLGFPTDAGPSSSDSSMSLRSRSDNSVIIRCALARRGAFWRVLTGLPSSALGEAPCR